MSINGGGTASFTWPDFSYRTTGAVVPAVTYTWGSYSQSLAPPRNFWRMNFLDINKQFGDIDLNPSNVISLVCSASNFMYCYDDNKVFSCNLNYYLNPYASTTSPASTGECKNECPVNYMRFPLDYNFNGRGYCIAQCDTNSQTCPYTVANYLTINQFGCSASFINMYYKCINDSSQWYDSK